MVAPLTVHLKRNNIICCYARLIACTGYINKGVKVMNINELFYMLSGDTTVMYSLLVEVPELVQKAKEVVNGKAKYKDLLELSYEYF